MSTITSPRESSVTGRRIPALITPTSSSRPSFDSTTARSASASPNRGPASQPAQPRRNRAALREYYNLKKEEQKADDASSEVSNNDQSDVKESEMDRDAFDGEAYVKNVLETQSLGELLKTYNQVLTDIRALDAEKKALVYDNYSKLIAATETIRKMRANMDPLNPMASTLDPAIAQIYERADHVKSDLRESMTPAQRVLAGMSEEERAKERQKTRSQEIAKRVLETPEKLRQLVADGKMEEAKKEWEAPLMLLEKWRESGLGGSDVQDCIDDGEAALKGDGLSEKSFVNVKGDK